MRRTARTIILAAGTLFVAGCAESDMRIAARWQHNQIAARDAVFKTTRDARMPKILPETYFAAAQLFESRGQVKNAIQQYRKAVAVNHSYVEAYHRLGLLLSMTRHREEAIAAFQRGVKLKPGNAMLRNNLGFELLLAKRWKEAEHQLLRAVKIKPDLARAHVNLGIVQSRLGRFDVALASFRKVLPEPDAYYNLGLMYRGQRRYEQAVEVFQYVLTLDPSFVAAQRQLDKIAQNAGTITPTETDAKLAASRPYREAKQTPPPVELDPCAELPGVVMPEPKPETWEETLDRFDRMIDPDCDAPTSIETNPAQIGQAIDNEAPVRIKKSEPARGIAEAIEAPASGKSAEPVLDLDAYIALLDRELGHTLAEGGIEEAVRQTGTKEGIEESANEIIASEQAVSIPDEEITTLSDAIDAIDSILSSDLADATILDDQPISMSLIDAPPTFSIAPEPIDNVDLALIASLPDEPEVIEEEEPCVENLLVDNAMRSTDVIGSIDRAPVRRPVKPIVPSRPTIAAITREPGPVCETIPVSWIDFSLVETIPVADICPADPPMSYTDIAPLNIAEIFSHATISNVSTGQTGDRPGSEVIQPIVSSTDSLALLEILEERLAIVRNEISCIDSASTPQMETLATIDTSHGELMGPPADLAPAPRKSVLTNRPMRARRKARLVSEEQIRAADLNAVKGNPEAAMPGTQPARASERSGASTPLHKFPDRRMAPIRRPKIRESGHEAGRDSSVDAALKMILQKLKEAEKGKADTSRRDEKGASAPEGAGAASDADDQTRYRQLHGDHGHSRDPLPED